MTFYSFDVVCHLGSKIEIRDSGLNPVSYLFSRCFPVKCDSFSRLSFLVVYSTHTGVPLHTRIYLVNRHLHTDDINFSSHHESDFDSGITHRVHNDLQHIF